ncbi:prominin-2-like [Heptranchias perlo]|uniref:prominin-2-like n=1 Tax=Heptranchias perlo TaxID=212740 RepID=UPI003559E8FD
MALFLVLVVTFLIPQCAISQNCTVDPLLFQNLSLRGFQRLSGDAGSIEPLYDMVQRYLDAVQPNAFPTDIIQGLLKDSNFVAENYQEVLRYGAGYLVSFIIGVLFFVIMPLVGLCFCCCRCCNNCGGQVKERTKSTDCQRQGLVIFLLMTTIIILAGVACAFTANQNVTDAMEPSVMGINESITDVVTYINRTLEAARKVTAQFSVPQNRILSELDNVGRSLGYTIKDALEPIVNPVLMMVSTSTRDLSSVIDHLMTINSTHSSLVETQQQLRSVQLDIKTTLNSPNCQNCTAAEAAIDNLQLNVTFSKPIEVQIVLTNATSFSPATLNNSLQQGNRSFNEIPGKVTNQTSQIIADIKRAIEDIEGNLSSIIERVQFLDSLQSQIGNLNSQKVLAVSRDVKQYDYYRWIVGIVLCCIILLIIACNVLGLGLGTIGIVTKDHPNSANGCSKSGANFLMAGVGFSFIFSSLLILLVFVTFLVGGNVQTVVCKPWASGEIYQFIDTLAAEDNRFNLSTYLNVSVSVSELYRQCEEGESLWNILSIDRILDVDTYLNLSTYTGDLVRKIERLNVNITGIILLDSAGRRSLRNFASSGIDRIDYMKLIEQSKNSLLKMSLLELVNVLESLNSSQPDVVISSNLTRQAEKLREIENTLQQKLVQLNTSAQYLESFSPSIQNVINNTIQSIDTAQREIISTTLTVVKNVTGCLTNRGLGYFDQYLQWVRKTIIDDLLSCRPAVILLNNLRVILCDYITDPWNAFWFCLGWCTLFLIPSIIFAVKTAKHYRPIKTKASSYEISEMINFKFPRIQNVHGPPVIPP